MSQKATMAPGMMEMTCRECGARFRNEVPVNVVIHDDGERLEKKRRRIAELEEQRDALLIVVERLTRDKNQALGEAAKWHSRCHEPGEWIIHDEMVTRLQELVKAWESEATGVLSTEYAVNKLREAVKGK